MIIEDRWHYPFAQIFVIVTKIRVWWTAVNTCLVFIWSGHKLPWIFINLYFKKIMNIPYRGLIVQILAGKIELYIIGTRARGKYLWIITYCTSQQEPQKWKIREIDDRVLTKNDWILKNSQKKWWWQIFICNFATRLSEGLSDEKFLTCF